MSRKPVLRTLPSLPPNLVNPARAQGSPSGSVLSAPTRSVVRGEGLVNPAVTGRTPSAVSASFDLNKILKAGPGPHLGRTLREMARARTSKSAIQFLSSRRGLSLTYDPINADVFAQAYAGAMGGMLNGKSINATQANLYVNQAVSAGAWAQEFDTLWDSDNALDEVAAQLILLESFAVWSGRSPSGLAFTAGQASATIAAIIVAIEDAEIAIDALGITPPAWGGGTQNYVTIGTAATVALGAAYTSVVGGPIDFTSHGGQFTLQFTSQATWAAGQNNTTTSFRLVLGAADGEVVTISCPTASAYSTSFAFSFTFDRLGVGLASTIDVQALTTATPTDASSLLNQLTLTEYVSQG